MKRSTMLGIILDVVTEYKDKEYSRLKDVAMAGDILNAVENAGMIPNQFYLVEQDEPVTISEIQDWSGFDFSAAWEPE